MCGGFNAICISFEWLGFIVATLLMTIAVGKLFHGKTILVLVTGLVLSMSTYYMFDRFLDVPLPLGFLVKDDPIWMY